MQAKHGSAVSVRSRGRLIGCCMALVMALGAVVLAPAANAETPPPTYLALGDSLAFGYTQEKFLVNFPTESPSFFKPGIRTRSPKTYAPKKPRVTRRSAKKKLWCSSMTAAPGRRARD